MVTTAHTAASYSSCDYVKCASDKPQLTTCRCPLAGPMHCIATTLHAARRASHLHPISVKPVLAPHARILHVQVQRLQMGIRAAEKETGR